MWNPGESVMVQVVLANAGNRAASGVLDIVTLDHESHQALHTTTLVIDLPAGATEGHTVTAFANAQPGRYSVNLLLDDAGYMSLPFVVAAENALLVVVEPDSQYQPINQETTIAIEVVDMLYAYTDATLTGYVLDPLFVTQPLNIARSGEGLYSATYTPTLPGNHEIFITATREHWRSATASTNFITEYASYLATSLTGKPQVGQLRTITMTVHNEHNLPVIGALVTISGTQEYATRITDALGEAVFSLLPASGTPYTVRVEKSGHATTLLALSVNPAQIYLPLVLRNH